MLTRGSGGRDAFLITRARWETASVGGDDAPVSSAGFGDGAQRRRSRAGRRDRLSDSDDSDCPPRQSPSKASAHQSRRATGRSSSVGPHQHGYDRSIVTDELETGYRGTFRMSTASAMECPVMNRLSSPPQEDYRDANVSRGYSTPRFSREARSRHNSRENMLSTSPAIDPRLSAFFTDKKSTSFSRASDADTAERAGRRRARRAQQPTVDISADEDEDSPAAYPVMSADWGVSPSRYDGGQKSAARSTPRRISGRLARQSLNSQVFSTPDLSRPDEPSVSTAGDEHGAGGRGSVDLFSPRDGAKASPRVNRRDLDEILLRAAQRRQTRLTARPPVSARDLFGDTKSRRFADGNLPQDLSSDRSSDTPEPPLDPSAIVGRPRAAARVRRDSEGSELSAAQSVSSERSSRSGRDSAAPEQRESLSTRHQRLRQQSGSVASQTSETSSTGRRRPRRSSRGRLLDVKSPELDIGEEEPAREVPNEHAAPARVKPAIPPRPPVPNRRHPDGRNAADRRTSATASRIISGQLSRQSRACVFSSPDLSRPDRSDESPSNWGRMRDRPGSSCGADDTADDPRSSPPTAASLGGWSHGNITGDQEEEVVITDRRQIPTGRRHKPKSVLHAQRSLDADVVFNDESANTEGRVPSADSASVQDFPVSRRREIPSPWSRVETPSPATSDATRDFPVVHQKSVLSRPHVLKLTSSVPDVLADLSVRTRVASPSSRSEGGRDGSAALQLARTTAAAAAGSGMPASALDGSARVSDVASVQTPGTEDETSKGELSVIERFALLKKRRASLDAVSSNIAPVSVPAEDNRENALSQRSVSTPVRSGEVERGSTLPRSFRTGARAATRSPATPAAAATASPASVTTPVTRRPRSRLRRRAASQSGSPDRMSVVSTGSERVLDRGRSRSPRCRITQLKLKPRRVSQSPDARRSSLTGGGARFWQSVTDLRSVGCAVTPSQDDIWHSVLRAAGVDASSETGQPPEAADAVGRSTTPDAADRSWMPQPWSGAGPAAQKPSPLASPSTETPEIPSAPPVRPPRKKRSRAGDATTDSRRRRVDENWNRIGDGGSSVSRSPSESCESSVPPSEAPGVACLTKPPKTPVEESPDANVRSTVVLQLADISGFLQDTRVADGDDETREIESLTDASSVDLELELGMDLDMETNSSQQEQEPSPAILLQTSAVKQNLIAFSPLKEPTDEQQPASGTAAAAAHRAPPAAAAATPAPLAVKQDNSGVDAPPAAPQGDLLKQNLSLQDQLLKRDVGFASMREASEKLEKHLARTNKDLEVYAATLTFLTSEKERQCSHLTDRLRELTGERDEAREEVANIEAMFADLHRKYEKSKSLVTEHRRHADSASAALRDAREQVSRETSRYDMLQQHAEDAMERLRSETEAAVKIQETEVLRLTMKLKLSENRAAKLEDTNKQLTAMCDELIQKMDVRQ